LPFNAVDQSREIANVESVASAERTPVGSTDITFNDQIVDGLENAGFAARSSAAENFVSDAPTDIVASQKQVEELEHQADISIAEPQSVPQTAEPPALLSDTPITARKTPEAKIIIDEEVVLTSNDKLESTVRQKRAATLKEETLARKSSIGTSSVKKRAFSPTVSNGTPDMEWEAFQKIALKNGIRKDEAFMHNYSFSRFQISF